MRYYFLTIGLLLSTLTIAQEEPEYRVIPSVTDWIEEINNWPDSIYKVENIKVKVDLRKDSTLVIGPSQVGTKNEKNYISINKQVDISSWELVSEHTALRGFALLNGLQFNKRVTFHDFKGEKPTGFHNVIFEDTVGFDSQVGYANIAIDNCHFKKFTRFIDIEGNGAINISNSVFEASMYMFRTPGEPLLRITESKFHKGLNLDRSQLRQLFVYNSEIGSISLENTNVQTAVYIMNSNVDLIQVEGASLPENNTYIPFDIIKEKLFVRYFDSTGFVTYQAKEDSDFEDKLHFDLLIASYKLLLQGYQNRGDQESYNACYVEMRNKETAYFKHQFNKNSNLDSFLVYQLNVFLRAFSDYGTKPTKAIVVSVYVILAFALVYLFFPNYWDSHGKNRIKDRFLFFHKYLRHNKAIQDVYLEEQQAELQSAYAFQKVLDDHKSEVPNFFYSAAKPLYRWSVAGTTLYAKLLSRVDFLKGSWKETEPQKRKLKTALTIMVFTFALVYDIFIKVLNALMLSINTFTTLGFGEIPIKGLPRYLAIIQGFIGWFMLTIFSVSLISQLLN